MKFKIPNYLTIGRIIIVPIFVFAYYLPGFYGDVIPFSLFVLASFTVFLEIPLLRASFLNLITQSLKLSACAGKNNIMFNKRKIEKNLTIFIKVF